MPHHTFGPKGHVAENVQRVWHTTCSSESKHLSIMMYHDVSCKLHTSQPESSHSKITGCVAGLCGNSVSQWIRPSAPRRPGRCSPNPPGLSRGVLCASWNFWSNMVKQCKTCHTKPSPINIKYFFWCIQMIFVILE